MTLDTLIMLSGAFVLLLPRLGFPRSWDDALLSLVGVVIIGLGIAVRRSGMKSTQNVDEKPPRGYEESKPRRIATVTPKSSDSFVEHESE